MRHSFASFLVNARRSLCEVQKILGHTQIKTTQLYAHLSQDMLIDAANVVPFTMALPMVSMVQHSPPQISQAA
ncbi:MAG: tyrosine-type recombinase/integrase [Polaromonas sp.]|nr:tyrosine-type recombinase/integrase [Polaromonas sp.]